jgi:dihydropteroate synthase
MDKSSLFYTKIMLNYNGNLLDFSKPLIMGILNVTPDSFYDGEKSMNEQLIITKAEKMINEGVDILDIGGMSTRPGAEILSSKEELKRILPVIEYLIQHHPSILLSIDTIHSSVAKEAILKGVHIVNDVSGGTYDSAILDVVATYKVPYIMMHSEGIPATKVPNSDRNKSLLLRNILKFFIDQITVCRKKGITDIIIDPGFGFGKSMDENYFILKNLEAFQILEKPILIGVSRKSMIYNKLGCSADEALNGTTILHTLALSKGANILRVHDVKEAVECRTLLDAVG